MRPYKSCLISLIASIFTLLLVSNVSAEEVLFSIEPGKIPYLNEGKILASWNPKGRPETQSESLKIYFHGKAEGCSPDAKNGLVEKYTKGGETCYFPSIDRKFCEPKIKTDNLCSFTCFNGGIKLRTGSGIGNEGLPCFINTRDAEGVGVGVDAYNLGNFVNFKLPDGKIKLDKYKKFKIIVQSSVEKISLNPTPREKPIQLHQKITIGFQNQYCIQEKKDKKSLCNVKYLLLQFVKRVSAKPHEWRNRVWFDQGQGGLPIISVFYNDPNLVTFCGDTLKHEPFKEAIFCYEISWEQFLMGLKSIASKHYNKPIESITPSDLISIFGTQYGNPSAWYLAVVSFSHEIHDPYKDYNNYIEGKLKKITVLYK